jgi:ABC-type transporter lipoprotein component MlaA
MFYSLVQLDLEAFVITVWRFGINSTIGVAGLYDAAGMFGLQPVEKDVDQTLSVYDIPNGPFFVLPILGASTVTNSLEWPVYIILSFYNPYMNIFSFGTPYSLTFSFLGPTIMNTVLSNYFGILYVPKILNTRINFEILMQDLHSTSIDGYVTLRNFYIQNQKYNISKENESMINGRLIKEKPLILLQRINEPLLVDDWQTKEDIVEYNFN